MITINLWDYLGGVFVISVIFLVSTIVYAIYIWVLNRPDSRALSPYVVGTAPDVIQGRFWKLRYAKGYAKTATLRTGVSVNVYNSRGRKVYDSRRSLAH